MKIKIQKNKDSNECIVSYFRARDLNKFRFALLKQIIDSKKSEVNVLIDTNQKKSKMDFDSISSYLKRMGYEFYEEDCPANEKKLLGFSIGKFIKQKTDKERLYVLILKPEEFTIELYNALIINYDIGIGFDRKIETEQLVKRAVEGLHAVLFDKNIFEESLYDSTMFETMRCTIDIEELAKDVCASL